MKLRALASGRNPRWAIWDRFEVPNYDTDGNYLTRWRIIQTPLFGIYLHRLDGPDPRTTLHDHPWNFHSLILRGGYIERRLDPHVMEVNENHRVDRHNFVRAHEAHAIVTLTRTPTWTLLFVGRRLRTWGYWDEPVSWIGDALAEFGDWQDTQWTWTEFNKHYHAGEFDAALQRRKAQQ